MPPAPPPQPGGGSPPKPVQKPSLFWVSVVICLISAAAGEIASKALSVVWLSHRVWASVLLVGRASMPV